MSIVMSESLRYFKLLGLNLQDVSGPSHLLKFWLLTVTTWMCTFMMCFDMLRHREFVTFENSVDAFVTVYVVIYKAVFFVIRRKDLAKMVGSLKAFKSSSTIPGTQLHDIVQGLQLRAFEIFRVCAISVFLAGSSFGLKPLIFWSRILPATFTLFCDIEKTWCYVVSYLCQLSSTFFCIIFIIITDGFYFALISSVYVEMETLKFGLRNLDDERGLGELVKQHNVILKFIADINELFQWVLLNHMIASLLAIWFEVFDLSIQEFPPPKSLLAKNFAFLLSYHMEALFQCASGEVVSNQALSIGDAAYECAWFGKIGLAKGLILVMQKSNQVVRLKFGQLWYLQLDTFIMVVKSSVSMLAFMQTIYNFDKTKENTP